MKITDVRINVSEKAEGNVKAYATITLDDAFAVHGLRIIDKEGDLRVVSPARKKKDGSFQDIAHPVTSEFRNEMVKAVLDAYDAKLKES